MQTKVIDNKDNTVTVIVKNKESHLKAVKYLGKYSQNKELLDETIKMIEFLKESKNVQS